MEIIERYSPKGVNLNNRGCKPMAAQTHRRASLRVPEGGELPLNCSGRDAINRVSMDDSFWAAGSVNINH